MIIETDRLVLKTLNTGDAEALLSYYISNKAFLEKFEPRRESCFYTLENQEESIKNEIKDRTEGRGLRLYICRKQEPQKIIGCVSLNNIVRGCFQSCFAGYKLSADNINQGYMKEALKALCRYAFNVMGLHRIEANIMPWNKASLAVAKSCGFAQEGSSPSYLNINGRWEEHVHMVLLNEKNMPRLRSALVIIDMQNGFVCKESALCIKHASETLPAIAACIEEARAENMPVFYIMRIYREDGSDVELCRYDVWKNNGMPLSPSAKGADSCEICSEIAPEPGDYVIYKPRWSAFFQTQLDMVLRRLKIDNIYLTGTTTPNCIRTTAYDALSLDYNTVVIEDCCSSQSSEIQKANMDDMQRAGVRIISSSDFCRQ